MPYSTFYNLPEEKRQKILEYAIDEFAANDYASASISKIVTRAGIAKGSLYQYFADKGDLYAYLLELVAEKKGAVMRGIGLAEAGSSVFEKMRRLVQVMTLFEMHYPKLARIGNRVASGKSPLPEEVLRKARQSTSQYFMGLIEEGQQGGEIRRDVDAGLAAYILTSTLAGMGSYLMDRAGSLPGGEAGDGTYPVAAAEIETVFNQLLSILRDGIAK